MLSPFGDRAELFHAPREVGDTLWLAAVQGNRPDLLFATVVRVGETGLGLPSMAGAVSDGPSVRSESSSNGERETTMCDLRSIVDLSMVVLTNASFEPSADRCGCETDGTWKM